MMVGMPPRLPPFDALLAFDAAVRLRSMTTAASELGLTQSAVSHRIRRLEAFMGASLLLRRNAGLEPTAAGQALAHDLGDVLAQLDNLRIRCACAGGDRLRVGVGPGLAQGWLMRRLPRFAADNPDVGIELPIVDVETPRPSSDLDVRLVWVAADELRATSTQKPLFQEGVFPVCHPSLLPPDFRPGDDPSALASLPLLHKGPAGAAASPEWSWPHWLGRFGLPPRPRESLRFASIDLALGAALEGAGAVLARTLLVHDALAEGRLVRLLSPGWDLPCYKAYLIRWPAARREDERLRRFVAWLADEAATTRADSLAASGRLA
jgi:LysR family glycine cleavage system transcriptional activator